MRKEIPFSPEKQLEVLESLKPHLASFVSERLLNWGLTSADFRLVDEAGFGYTGVPIYGPELARVEEGWHPHIDISVKEERYTGPKLSKVHPTKIILPPMVAAEISQNYEIDVADFIKGSEGFFALPTIPVRLREDTEVLVPEPAAHVRTFARETILYYSLRLAGEEKLEEWFNKLKMLRDVSRQVHKPEVAEAANQMINLSLQKWQEQNFSWSLE